jgi:hypothetical protein
MAQSTAPSAPPVRPPSGPGSRFDPGFGRHKLPPPRAPSVRSAGFNPFDRPTNTAELRDCLQTAANEYRVAMLDPRTVVDVESTITIKQTSNDGSSWGVNGNHARLRWVGPVGDDMVVYQGVAGVYNRQLFIEKLNLYGGGYEGRPCGFCLKLHAPDGDPGSLYKFTLRDVFANYGTWGIGLVGAVFEGLVENCHGESNEQDGLVMAHSGLDGSAPWSVVSNIMAIHPNFSRNYGAGIRSVNSANIVLGSFVNNALGGVLAPEGLRLAFGCNGENTGETVLDAPYSGWGTAIIGNSGSTDGVTVAAKWQDGAWVPVGKPTLYTLAIDAAGQQEHNSVAYYGDGTNRDKVAVVKP